MDRLLGIAGHRKRRKTGGKKALARAKLRLSLFVLNFIGGSNLFNQLGVFAA
jgi:hypothetical protein